MDTQGQRNLGSDRRGGGGWAIYTDTTTINPPPANHDCCPSMRDWCKLLSLSQVWGIIDKRSPTLAYTCTDSCWSRSSELPSLSPWWDIFHTWSKTSWYIKIAWSLFWSLSVPLYQDPCITISQTGVRNILTAQGIWTVGQNLQQKWTLAPDLPFPVSLLWDISRNLETWIHTGNHKLESSS